MVNPQLTPFFNLIQTALQTTRITSSECLQPLPHKQKFKTGPTDPSTCSDYTQSPSYLKRQPAQVLRHSTRTGTKSLTLDRPPGSATAPFLRLPLLGTLLFPNVASDCRDHCANERTFLSWLRLSIYLAVVSAAIVISFHLKHKPTDIERHASLPLGIIFWLLSIASLASGLANYINTVTRYSRRQALVQAGWKTQLVCYTHHLGFCLCTNETEGLYRVGHRHYRGLRALLDARGKDCLKPGWLRL